MTIDTKYKNLYLDIRNNGVDFEGRNGGTRAIYNAFPQISWDLKNTFPIIACRKQNIKHYLNEFLWEINGGNNVNGLNGFYYPNVDSRFLWDTWADETGYIPYSYGSCWRSNGEISSGQSFNQLLFLEEEIIKNPRSRRLTLVTQDVGKNIVFGTENAISTKFPAQVPPCHSVLHFTSDGEDLNLHVMSRSQDIICGLPGDMIRYSLMTQCLALIANLKPAIVCFSFTNVHYYKQHEEKMDTIIFNDINPENRPIMSIENVGQESLYDFTWLDFNLKGYSPNKFVSFPLVA